MYIFTSLQKNERLFIYLEHYILKIKEIYLSFQFRNSVTGKRQILERYKERSEGDLNEDRASTEDENQKEN